MDICFVSPAYGRYAITELVLEQRNLLIDELGLAGIKAMSLIVADDENLDIACSFGCEVLEYPNRPLGAKCGAGVVRAAELASTIVWVGSDDLIHIDAFANFTDTLIPTIRTGARFSLMDIRRQKVMQCKGHSMFGAVPWIVPSVLIQTKTRMPVSKTLEKGLDGNFMRNIRRNLTPYTVEVDDPHAFRSVDLKTEYNIHNYKALSALGIEKEQDAGEALAGYFPDSIIKKLLSIRMGEYGQ